MALEPLTISTAAELLGVSTRQMRTYARRPDFPAPVSRAGRGRKWSAPAVHAWSIEFEIEKRGRVLSTVDEDGNETPPIDLSTERARLARAQAVEKEMTIAVKRGDLVPRGAAQHALAGAVHVARGVLLSVHGRCAALRPDMAPEVVEEIRRAHVEALAALSEAPLPGKVNGANGADHG